MTQFVKASYTFKNPNKIVKKLPQTEQAQKVDLPAKMPAFQIPADTHTII